MEQTDNVRASLFTQSFSSMIATNNNAYNSSNVYGYTTPKKRYTREEVERIIDGGSILQQQVLSRDYYDIDGFYKRIITYYATLYKYIGILIPNVNSSQKPNEGHKKRYYNALNYIEKMRIPEFFTRCSLRALIDGCYYGVIRKTDKNVFSIIDLPAKYCRTNFKDDQGNDIVEFNVSYFDSIVSPVDKENCLKVYPKEIVKYYKKYHLGKINTPWMKVPTNIGVCFPISENCRPIFLSVIIAIQDYDEAVEIEKESQIEQIKKILIQEMPHLNDGTLVFEPEEALEMHRGAVGMLRKNKNVDVLTTYADVKPMDAKTNQNIANTFLERMSTNIYTKTGVSGELFDSSSNLALQYSLKNDIAFMTLLINKYSSFVTNLLNNLFSNSQINFKYTILPITYYNEKDYVDLSFKLAGSGYSFILPSLAMGLTQKDLVSVKDLENSILNLSDKLIPLSSAFNTPAAARTGGVNQDGTQKIDRGKNPQVELEESKPGAREKEDDQKTEKTEKNKESM